MVSYSTFKVISGTTRTRQLTSDTAQDCPETLVTQEESLIQYQAL